MTLHTNRMRLGAAMAAALLCATGALAEAGSISLSAKVEKRVLAQNPDGTAAELYVPAAEVVPGDVVAYTIEAKNISQQNADRVVVTDPIPAEVTYLDGTATDAGAQVLFSVDGGFRFDRPEKLTVANEDGTRRPALASDYTHVRWVFAAPLAPAEQRSVRFLAQLE
ncbi:MAG: DUF11 domain-containing protein [Deltaproteobacteria bacterium]|nr:DUF11 domain-containing protein [Deltaproteobacteria bacterium]